MTPAAIRPARRDSRGSSGAAGPLAPPLGIAGAAGPRQAEHGESITSRSSCEAGRTRPSRQVELGGHQRRRRRWPRTPHTWISTEPTAGVNSARRSCVRAASAAQTVEDGRSGGRVGMGRKAPGRHRDADRRDRQSAIYSPHLSPLRRPMEGVPKIDAITKVPPMTVDPPPITLPSVVSDDNPLITEPPPARRDPTGHRDRTTSSPRTTPTSWQRLHSSARRIWRWRQRRCRTMLKRGKARGRQGAFHAAGRLNGCAAGSSHQRTAWRRGIRSN